MSLNISPIQITGASIWVDRAKEGCAPFQWAREFLQNAIEAGATRVEFGLDDQAARFKNPIYRRTIIDNGCGMDAKSLRKFLSTLGISSKEIGSVHNNYGIGAKIASLPWNPKGLVVISYQGGKGAMVKIIHDPSSMTYGLERIMTDDGPNDVYDPEEIDWSKIPGAIDYSALRPDWVKESGTIILMMGSDEYPDTMDGDPSRRESSRRGLEHYINTRFINLRKHHVVVGLINREEVEGRGRMPAQGHLSKTRSAQNAVCRGLLGYLFDSKIDCERGNITLKDGETRIFWQLDAENQKNNYNSNLATESGFIGVQYGNEMYDHSTDKRRFRNFGVSEASVQRRLRIIVMPPKYERGKKSGVFSNIERSNLRYTTKDGDSDGRLPFEEWGLEFSQSMPAQIADAIQNSQKGLSGSIEDSELLRRIIDEYGSRWRGQGVLSDAEGRMKGSVSKHRHKRAAEGSEETESGVADGGTRQPKTRSIRLSGDGTISGSEQSIKKIDAPGWKFVQEDSFSARYILACWSPNDPTGECVLINQSADIFKQTVKYHQSKYPDVHAEEVENQVKKAFGITVAAKAAHISSLYKGVLPKQEIVDRFLSEEALTTAVCGLIAEEALIERFLRDRLGRAKT